MSHHSPCLVFFNLYPLAAPQDSEQLGQHCIQIAFGERQARVLLFSHTLLGGNVNSPQSDQSASDRFFTSRPSWAQEDYSLAQRIAPEDQWPSLLASFVYPESSELVPVNFEFWTKSVSTHSKAHLPSPCQRTEVANTTLSPTPAEEPREPGTSLLVSTLSDPTQ